VIHVTTPAEQRAHLLPRVAVLGNSLHVIDACAAATHLAEAGFAPYCPQTNLWDARELSLEAFTACCMAFLPFCAAIYLLPDLDKTPTGRRLHAFAAAQGLPVFWELEALKAEFAERLQPTTAAPRPA
jgi:hypothetical protein